MSSWKFSARFLANDSKTYFAALNDTQDAVHIEGQKIDAFATFEDLQSGKGSTSVTVQKVCS